MARLSRGAVLLLAFLAFAAFTDVALAAKKRRPPPRRPPPRRPPPKSHKPPPKSLKTPPPTSGTKAPPASPITHYPPFSIPTIPVTNLQTFLINNPDYIALASFGSLTPSLANVFNSATINATVFVPSNVAIEQFIVPFGNLSDPAVLLANLQLLIGAVSYHVVPGPGLLSSALSDGQQLKTVQGNNLTIIKSAGKLSVRGGLSTNVANVVKGDYKVGSGMVVHLIDAVLVPLAPPPSPPGPPLPTTGYTNLLEAIRAQPELSIALSFFNGIQQIDGAQQIFQQLLSQPLTAFIPTNTALLAGLQQLGLTLDIVQQNPAVALTTLIGSLVPGQRLSSNQLTNGLSLATGVPGVIAGPTITVRRTGTTVVLVGPVNNATVVKADIGGGAGVLHIVDAVILPAAGRK